MSVIGTDSDLFKTLGLSRELQQDSNDKQLQLEDFLELMITELTHQDPFKPMENSELATQISQFATVSGIEELNDSFTGLSGNLLSDQSLQAANLVGHDVLVPTDSGYLPPGGSLAGVVGLDSSASDVRVRITDATGALVREIGFGTQPAGELNFSWDGMTDSGEFAAPGRYRVSAEAEVDGEAFAPYLLTRARVDSVSIGSGGQGMALNLAGLGAVAYDDIAEIY